MPKDSTQEKIEELQLEAEAAYQEFLKRLKKLEQEREAVVADAIQQIDEVKIKNIRGKLGLSE